jgi:hypothetical protein
MFSVPATERRSQLWLFMRGWRWETGPVANFVTAKFGEVAQFLTFVRSRYPS